MAKSKSKAKAKEETKTEVIYKKVTLQEFIARLKAPGITVENLNLLSGIVHTFVNGEFAAAVILNADGLELASIENHTTYDVVYIYERSAQDQIVALIDKWPDTKSVTIHAKYEEVEPA